MQPLILVRRCWQEGDSKKSAAISLQYAMGCHHPILGLLFHVNCPSAPCHGEVQKGRGTRSLLINALHTCCKPTAGTYAIGAEWNRDGSSCLNTR